MLKAIFVDYTGTIIEEGGPAMQELVLRAYKNSDIESPQAMVALWWKLLKEYEQESYGDSFVTEDEIVDKILNTLVKEIHLKDDPDELHELCRQFWKYAPAFPDAAEFFEKCTLPVYIISNNAARYIEEGMKDKGFAPAGIICGEMAKAYKPHRELFEKALEVSGYRADEVIHVGDSVSSDVLGAKSAGIRPVLIDRKGEQKVDGVTVIQTLPEVLEF